MSAFITDENTTINIGVIAGKSWRENVRISSLKNFGIEGVLVPLLVPLLLQLVQYPRFSPHFIHSCLRRWYGKCQGQEVVEQTNAGDFVD